MTYYKELNAIVIFIESNMKERISWDSISMAVGFSIPHIREIFGISFRKPLAKYILERKISHVAYEISKSNKRLTEIAFKYGFETYEVFIRAFRRITGLTPSKFQKSSYYVSIAHISSGVYGPIIHTKKKDDVIMSTIQNKFSDCVLSGVPAVDFGGGVKSTFPACLQTCLAYLGQEIDYDYLMVTSGAAFRLRWNTDYLDGGNINICNTFEDPYKPLELSLKASGRAYNILERDKNTTKDDFVLFIAKEIQEGRPCIAFGIVGPPEACLVTGYRDNCNKLLGYSLFQNDPPFCTHTIVEESGYFVCSDWWENKWQGEVKPIISIGECVGQTPNVLEIAKIAIEVMDDKKIWQYASGQHAYDEVIEFLLDDSKWTEAVLESQLFEQVTIYGDAMVMLCNRSSAANFFENNPSVNSNAEQLLNEIVKKIRQVAELPDKMCNIPPMGWNMGMEMINYICKPQARKEIASYFHEAKKIEKQIVDLFRQVVTLDI